MPGVFWEFQILIYSIYETKKQQAHTNQSQNPPATELQAFQPVQFVNQVRRKNLIMRFPPIHILVKTVHQEVSSKKKVNAFLFQKHMSLPEKNVIENVLRQNQLDGLSVQKLLLQRLSQ